MNNRRARRTIFKDILKREPSARIETNENNEQQITYSDTQASLEIYYRFVCTFEEQIQYLVEKAQKDFVVFLDIDYSMINDSINYFIDEAHDQKF